MEETKKDVDIQTASDDWTIALMEKGLIVKVFMKRWRGTARIKTEDLGLTFSSEESLKFMKKYMILGTEKIFPPEILNEITHIEQKSRMCLNDYSFETLWGRFIPFSAFDTWKSENEKIKEEYMSMARRIEEKYTEIVQVVKENYRQLAKETWKRIYPDDMQEPSESFVENFTSRITAKIPPAEAISDSFSYFEVYLSIPLPSMLADDIKKSSMCKMEKDTQTLIEIEKQRKIVADTDIEIATKSMIAKEYVEHKKELIQGFLEATVVAMRQGVAEMCETITESLKNSENVDIRKNQVDKIKRFIEQTHLLNFHNDDEIKKALNELKHEVEKYKGERDKNIVLTKLKTLSDVVSKEFN